jgi:HPt (histidine-containing phosphotransfer) domain-containing protein
MSDNDVDKEISFDHLERYLSGDGDLIAEVFGLFKNQMDMWAKHLNVQLDDDNWGAMMHSIKGTASAVGAHNLQQLCGNAEQLIGEKNVEAVRAARLQEILFSIDRALMEIARWEYRRTIDSIRS